MTVFSALVLLLSLSSGPLSAEVADFELLAGQDFTCRAAGRGQVTCWGDHDLAAMPSASPPRAWRKRVVSDRDDCWLAVDGTLDCKHHERRMFVRDVATDDTSFCIVADHGGVLCDGGITVPPASPAQTIVAQQSAGDADRGFFCALREDGDVLCWRPNCPQSMHSPQVVVTGALELAGGDRLCARTASGVLCWEAPEERCDSAHEYVSPVSVRDLGAATQIAVGAGNACARHEDGGVSCWSTETESPTGMRAYSLPWLRPAAALALGYHHACILDEQGEAWCWGANDRRQLERSASPRVVPQPQAIHGVEGAVSLAGNEEQTCALLVDHRVACWGTRFADRGICGWHGEASIVPALSGAVELAPWGENTMCARMPSHEVRCWGAWNAPKLASPSSIPDKLVGDGHWLCIGGGNGEALCHLGSSRGDGRTVRVPRRHALELCPETYGRDPRVRLLPGEVALVPASLPTGGAQAERALVQCSLVHACALDRTGGVRCSGSNRYGQLGLGAASDDTTAEPVQVHALDARIDEVSNGFWFSCARHATGRVSCWGDNSASQLGQGPRGAELPFSATPLPVPGLADAIQVLAVDRRACVVHGHGGVSCWGSNWTGESGAGDGMPRRTPLQVLLPDDSRGSFKD